MGFASCMPADALVEFFIAGHPLSWTFSAKFELLSGVRSGSVCYPGKFHGDMLLCGNAGYVGL